MQTNRFMSHDIHVSDYTTTNIASELTRIYISEGLSGISDVDNIILDQLPLRDALNMFLANNDLFWRKRVLAKHTFNAHTI